VLTADDLGPGTWTGPFESFSEAASERRLTFCNRDVGVWIYPDASAESQASSIWESDGVIVWSLANRQPTEGDAEDKLASARAMEPCVAQAEGKEPAAFTFADDGTTVLVEDRNEDNGALWVTEQAFTVRDDTFVAVMVSYPADADPTVSAEDLLDLAVEAAVDLPED
jgi:hypothetical protein